MKSKLRILLIEDDVADAELITHELASSDFAFDLKRVQTEADFRQELEGHRPDLVLADNKAVSFGGFRALEIARNIDGALPFIFVSGSNDQGLVEHMYEEGATDYVFKRDIHDLNPTITHALEDPVPVASDFSLAPEPATVQPELKLSLPNPPPETPPIAKGIGRLSFCSRCRIAHDESGQFVHLEEYCIRFDEVIIIQETCSVCAHLPW